ncbi:MAG: CPBP family intramembrane glutamic endopeptidase [Candidatus Aminicenantales bacterium]
MKKIPKLILVLFVNQCFVGFLAILISKTLGSSHISSFLAYISRPLFLAMTVSIFYTRSLARVPSFLGFHKKFFRPWILGMILTIPNGLLILFLLNWKHLPFSFEFGEALIHLIFIFLGPGLFEEGLFRGLVFRRLLETMPWWKAGLYTGGLFAFFHLGNLALGYPLAQVLFQLLHVVLLSLLLGFLTWKLNGNIWACVAFHTINNFYAATLISDPHLQQYLIPFFLLGVLGLTFSFAGAIILLRRKREKLETVP